MSFAVFAILVAGAAYFGAQFRPDSWYRGLRKPAWTPPDWVFGPVWTMLYIAIALAGWLVWEAGGQTWTPPMTFWIAQLLLNAAWS